jgi:hypothetical protein
MVPPGQDRLSGRIEAGESYPDRQGECVCGPQTSKKAIGAVAVELNHGKISSAGLRCAPDLSPSSLTDLLAEAVLPESSIHTDGWYACQGLANRSAPARLTTTSLRHLASGPARENRGPPPLSSVEEEDLLG